MGQKPLIEPITPQDVIEPLDANDLAIPASKPQVQFGEQPDNRSFWDKINTPLLGMTPEMRKAAQQYAEPGLNDTYLSGATKGFISGAGQGLADFGSALTSPLSLGLMPFGMSEKMAIQIGEELFAAGKTAQAARMFDIANKMHIPGRVAAGAMIGHGGYKALTEEHPGDLPAGLTELAMGLGGIAHTPAGPGQLNSQIPDLVDKLHETLAGAKDYNRPDKPNEFQLRPQDYYQGPLALPPRRFNLAYSPKITDVGQTSQSGPFVAGHAGIAEPRMYNIDFGTTPPDQLSVGNIFEKNPITGEPGKPVVMANGAIANPEEVAQVPPHIAAEYGTGLGEPAPFREVEGPAPMPADLQGIAEPIHPSDVIEQPRAQEPQSPGANIVQEIDDARRQGFTVVSPTNTPRIAPGYEIKSTLSNGALVIGPKTEAPSFGPKVDENLLTRFIKEDKGEFDPEELKRNFGDILSARIPKDVMYGKSEFQRTIETIPRMSVKKAQETADRFSEMLRHVSSDRPNTVKQLTIIRDTALARARGQIPSTWGVRAGIDITTPDEGIESARIGQGRGQIGVNIRHSAEELTKGYNSPLPHIMVREGMQNALDAVRSLGKLGRIFVTFIDKDSISNRPSSIKISDNGPGMSEDELYTVYSDLHSSGKGADVGASGGKGVGKATYMLGGDHFSVETVKEINGQKIKSSFAGKPNDLLGGFDVHTEIVDPSTPTGTTFITTLKADQANYHSRNAMDYIRKYSRNREAEIIYKKSAGALPETLDLKGNSLDQKLVDNAPVNNRTSNVDVYLPHDAKFGRASSTSVEYLNNGMWQYNNDYFPLDEETNGIPNKIIVDVKPQVPEVSDPNIPGSEETSRHYPFPVQRESIKEPTNGEINRIIKEKLIRPFADKKKQDLATLWKQMETEPAGGSMARESVFFDPGDRLTSEEKEIVKNSPEMRDMRMVVDNLLHEIIVKVGKRAYADKLVRTGISMDPDRYGVHIPNPTAPKAESAIFVNPFAHWEISDSPQSAALDLVTTALHEAAHIGHDDPARSELSIRPDDLNDPRVGRYLQTYINQVMTQGGVDMGHGVSFLRRLGDIYAKTGTGTAFRFADIFEHLFTGGKPESGEYSPEIQRLLQIYQESRRRAPTTEDILSGTGVKSAIEGSDAGNVSGANRSNGERASTLTPDDEKMYDEDYGIPKQQTINPFKNIWNAGRAFSLGGDISYALRQAAPYLFHKEYWKAWGPAAKAFGDEAASRMAAEAMHEDPMYSRAEKDGLFLADIHNRGGSRGEIIESDLPERVPIAKKYYRATNRANTGFLNAVRFGVYKQMIGAAEAMGANLDEVGPKYADRINTMTGHASLNFEGPQFKAFGKDIDLSIHGEQPGTASFLSYTMMAPRFLASRLKMFTQMGLSTLPVPDAWIGMDPVLRQEALRNLFAVTTMAIGEQMLTKMTGGRLEQDPTSADYLKSRFGSTRFDPLIGLQQYIVLAARMIKGTSKSTETGEKYVLGQKYGYQDRTDVATRFLTNKTHPNIRFAIELGRALQGDITKLNTWKNAKSYGKPFNLGLTQQFQNDPIHRGIFQPLEQRGLSHLVEQGLRTPFENEFLKTFVPITLQDIYEVSKTNPNLLPVAAPLSVLGHSEQTYR